MKPLLGLANLDVLELHGNQISDVTPLSGLTNLSYLTLSENPINNCQSLPEKLRNYCQ
ncbi:leucine-rich repeat domain-containing protein [Crinalium epipsammum]|uniref:leucine-rich repeat domain-containing protein n=1 Tax=Crinalium epipsammum TaxID=241425 RepID=UPI001E539FB6|nr:leucine-rich repeat domain-containing protein [Crinalium epipsammum]